MQQSNDFNNGLGEEIQIIEVLPDEYNSIEDDSLDYFFRCTGIKYLENKTTTESYKKGDERSTPYKKYMDYITVYEYLISNLKNKEIKDQLKNIYEPVLKNIYSGSDNSNSESIEDKFLSEKILFKGKYTVTKNCKGYLIKVKSGLDKSYGYIYLINIKKSGKISKMKMEYILNVYPFINYPNSGYIGKEFDLKFNDDFDNKNFKGVFNLTNKTLLNNSFKKKSIQ